jgi:hypothetical protein
MVDRLIIISPTDMNGQRLGAGRQFGGKKGTSHAQMLIFADGETLVTPSGPSISQQNILVVGFNPSEKY